MEREMSKYNQIERLQGYWHKDVVLYRGDDVIDTGTVQEVADRRHVRKDTIYWLTSPTAHRRAASRKDQTKAMRGILV